MQIIFHSIHLKTISDKKSCNCQVFIYRCIFKAKKQWQDDFIDFKTAMNYFQHSSYLCVLKDSTDGKKLLDNVYSFIRKKFFFRNCFFSLKKMECLLCDFQFNKVNLRKNHYVCFHKVDENSLYFLDLFEPDTIDCVCGICNVKFDTCRKKKNHMFLCHYSTKQSGGRLQRACDLPLNILKR